MKAHLPDFPWDTLAPFLEIARAHPDGLVDLSVGTPVDPTPEVVQHGLSDASNAPGYPTTAGSPDLIDACRGWLTRRVHSVPDVGVLPTIGSKEMVAWLPTGLGLGSEDVVVIPRIAYPTYRVGGLWAGAEVVATDEVEGVEGASMIWLNTPSNPTGQVLDVERMAQIVQWARVRNIPVVSDECYIELGWEEQPASILDPRVNGGDPTGVLAVHSLSKRSSMAGYRFGFVAGDPATVASLLEVRKHLGMMVPTPIQRAAIAAYDDDRHVEIQRELYARRREVLRRALLGAGFRIDHSHAGLYLWVTRDEDSWSTTRWFADRGIVVAPGDFYGDDVHVRIALTATDERIDAAVTRLSDA
jgi:succinyldiaminopimelate transaminase